jgi:hypothetical protein
VSFKGTGAVANGTFSFLIGGESISGTGYTKIDTEGYDMASASVLAFINTTWGTNYTIRFTLHGDTDYMTVNME